MSKHLTRTNEEMFALACDICAYLNEIVALDQPAMHALTEHRVACGAALRAHATTQVVVEHDVGHVGLLGVLNGLIGVRADGWGYLAGVYDDDGQLLGFMPVARLEFNDPEPPKVE